jgi:hypothetical protein
MTHTMMLVTHGAALAQGFRISATCESCQFLQPLATLNRGRADQALTTFTCTLAQRPGDSREPWSLLYTASAKNQPE